MLRNNSRFSKSPCLGTAREFVADLFDQDGRLCHVDEDIQRCIRLKKWLEDTDPGHFVSSKQPHTKDSLISVVIPMYNASRWIETALKSLLLQKDNMEVFCVDDASTDDTYERVQRLFGDDGRVCLVRLEENVGPYQIRNWAASRLARGQWLAFQDADDFSHPNRFAMQKEWMERHGIIACGTSVHQVFPAHITPNRGDTEKWENEGLFHDLAFYFDLPKTTRAQTVCEALLDRSPLFFQKNGASVTQVPTTDSPAFYPTMMIHRDTFLSLGGFNGHTVIHADKAFAYRLTRFHEIGNVPAILYTRLIHAQSLTQRPETGYSSSLRQVQHAALLEKDKKVSAAIENDDRETVLQLCVSDLYHADVRVADWQAQFAVPGL